MCITKQIKALTLAAALAALPGASPGFGTINGLGQDTEHEKITRLGLAGLGFEPNTMDEIAGKGGTFGAVGAPDHPLRGLMSEHKAHCDGGDHLAIAGYPHSAVDAEKVLTDCRNWILDNMDKAVAAAGALLDRNGNIRDSQIPTFFSCTYNGKSGRAKCNVLDALGLALHASQDFYSHTNWTDTGAPPPGTVDNPQGLLNTATNDWINDRNASFSSGLISGCFDGVPESFHCDGRVRHDVLNKDKGAIDVNTGTIGAGTTPRAQGNANFANAVTIAIADTKRKWLMFETMVKAQYGEARGAKIICAMKRDNPAKTC